MLASKQASVIGTDSQGDGDVGVERQTEEAFNLLLMAVDEVQATDVNDGKPGSEARRVALAGFTPAQVEAARQALAGAQALHGAVKAPADSGETRSEGHGRQGGCEDTAAYPFALALPAHTSLAAAAAANPGVPTHVLLQLSGIVQGASLAASGRANGKRKRGDAAAVVPSGAPARPPPVRVRQGKPEKEHVIPSKDIDECLRMHWDSLPSRGYTGGGVELLQQLVQGDAEFRRKVRDTMADALRPWWLAQFAKAMNRAAGLTEEVPLQCVSGSSAPSAGKRSIVKSIAQEAKKALRQWTVEQWCLCLAFNLTTDGGSHLNPALLRTLNDVAGTSADKVGKTHVRNWLREKFGIPRWPGPQLRKALVRFYQCQLEPTTAVAAAAAAAVDSAAPDGAPKRRRGIFSERELSAEHYWAFGLEPPTGPGAPVGGVLPSLPPQVSVAPVARPPLVVAPNAATALGVPMAPRVPMQSARQPMHLAGVPSASESMASASMPVIVPGSLQLSSVSSPSAPMVGAPAGSMPLASAPLASVPVAVGSLGSLPMASAPISQLFVASMGAFTVPMTAQMAAIPVSAGAQLQMLPPMATLPVQGGSLQMAPPPSASLTGP